MKLNVTEKAIEKLKELMEEKQTDKHLRIFIAGYGWGGPSIGLALEEPKDDDIKVEVDNLNFTVEDGLSDTFDVLTVDYSDSWMKRGFSVVPGTGSNNNTRSCWDKPYWLISFVFMV